MRHPIDQTIRTTRFPARVPVTSASARLSGPVPEHDVTASGSSSPVSATASPAITAFTIRASAPVVTGLNMDGIQARRHNAARQHRPQWLGDDLPLPITAPMYSTSPPPTWPRVPGRARTTSQPASPGSRPNTPLLRGTRQRRQRRGRGPRARLLHPRQPTVQQQRLPRDDGRRPR